MRQYLVIVECIIEYQDTFLMIKRPDFGYAGGLLSGPGGKVDEEDEVNNYDILRAAVKREVYEEVGLTLNAPITYVTTSFFVGNKGIPVVNSVFHCKLDSKPEITASPREVAEHYWLTYDEINTAPNAPDWLKHFLQLICKQ